MQFKHYFLWDNEMTLIWIFLSFYCDTSFQYITAVSVVTGIENLGDLQAGRLIYYFTIRARRDFLYSPWKNVPRLEMIGFAVS